MKLALLAAIMVLTGWCHASTITVGGTGSDHATIQEAVNAASPGDTILVRPGTYHENVELDKRLTIRGEGSPMVDGDGVESPITIWASGIDLKGLILANSSEHGAGIYVPMNIFSDSNDNVIRDNMICNNSLGIALKYSSNNTLSNNSIMNNQHAGIDIQHCWNNNLSGNMIINNSNGIVLIDASKNLIEDNRIEDHRDHGILMHHMLSEAGAYGFCSNNTIWRNTITNNGYGIYLQHARNNTIYENRLINNTVSNAYDNPRGDGVNFWDNGTVGNYYVDLPKPAVDKGSEDGLTSQIVSGLLGIIFGSSEPDAPVGTGAARAIPGGMSEDRHPRILNN